MLSLLAILGINNGPFKATALESIGIAQRTGAIISEHLYGKLRQIAGVAGIEEAVRRTIEYASSIDDLARRLGIGTEALQAWDYALKLNGSSIQEAATFFERMSSNRQKALDGDEKLLAHFRNLGVSIDSLKTKRLEDIALDIALTYEGGDPQKLIADLRAIGGRGAGQMAAAFRSGLPELIAGADEAGVVMSDAVIARLKEAGDRFVTIWKQVMVNLGPPTAAVADFLSDLFHGIQMQLVRTYASIEAAAKGMGLKDTDAYVDAVGQAYADRIVKEEQDRAMARRRAFQNLSGGGAGDVDPETGESKKTPLEKQLEKNARLKKDIAAAEERNYMMTLDKDQKLLENAKQRLRVHKEIKFLQDTLQWNQDAKKLGLKTAGPESDAKLDEKRLELLKEGSRLDEEFLHLNKETKDKSAKPDHHRMHGDANALQRIGAYAPNIHESLSLDVHKRTEQHIKEMKKDIRAMATRGHGSGAKFE